MVSDIRRSIFETIRAAAKNGATDSLEFTVKFNELMTLAGIEQEFDTTNIKLTDKMVFEILEHESIVRELYLDSRGIPTWGIGVTDESGHRVERYRHKPQTIEKCLEIYIWLLRRKYLPEVLKAFEGYQLNENEVAGALSFHYNTGGIGKASWVKSVKQGKKDQAYMQFLLWNKPKEIIPRRKLERDLFFKSRWTYDGIATVYPVKTPSLKPDWQNAKQVDIREPVREALKKEYENA